MVSFFLVGHVEVIGDKGFRNEVSGLETNSIDLESAIKKDFQVKGVNEEVNIKRETNGNHLEVENEVEPICGVNINTPDTIIDDLQNKSAENQKKKIKELLNRRLDSLKDNVLKAEVAALVIGKIYDEEYEKGKEVRARFQVAEEVCQQAYTLFYSLKKRLYDKKKLFYMYKEDATAARNFASGGDKVAFHHPCVNQVEKILEESNSNEEFRKDYISRTTPSTLVETSFESHMNERIAVKAVPISSKLESTSVVSKVELGKKTVSCVSDISKRTATNSVPISSETESVLLFSKVEQRKKDDFNP
ncbi:unnamed protein product [Lactuca saligna]|uniref:Uncharacterized protein n=1 Tax=Lactuca saligna TaxID=75948 RepID=A0AA35YGQ3_LACSI|nr:unnamed protein product [Lactuca saligna]